jgi:hypothetical protein
MTGKPKVILNLALIGFLVLSVVIESANHLLTYSFPLGYHLNIHISSLTILENLKNRPAAERTILEQAAS